MNDKEKAAAAKKARKEARRAEKRSLAAESESAAQELGASVQVAASKSNANRPLPIPPQHLTSSNHCTICLFYQYKEPSWTSKEHKAALNKVHELTKKYTITGRGRCAPEGLNCTLTASANDMRAFCYSLREWDPSLFNPTDFKLEDGVPTDKRFRTFTLRKVDELVGYALDGIRAPSLNRHSGLHLEAPDYHKAMQQKDTVIIDVRNAYESDIGHFQPPAGGATLLDPKMRTSQDFPKWLNAPETKEKLQNKTVMMYCTGGIRCERATALLNQITDAEPEFETKGVVMVRGGIERYLKTFPEGGYWKGTNYLFDKRMEQAPLNKTIEELEKDVESACCVCAKGYAHYRGQFKCAAMLPSGGLPCAVPVIVCDEIECQNIATNEPHKLQCPLCAKGYQTPNTAPDLLRQKRKLGLIQKGGMDVVTGQKVDGNNECCMAKGGRSLDSSIISRRLFVGKLPLTITATKLRQAFEAVDCRMEYVHWIRDHDSQAFFGSAFCHMASEDDARKVQELNGCLCLPNEFRRTKGRKKKCQRVARLAFAPVREAEMWPPVSFCETEYPPIGT